MSSPESRAREGCEKCRETGVVGGRTVVNSPDFAERYVTGNPERPCPECGPDGRVTKLIREAEERGRGALLPLVVKLEDCLSGHNIGLNCNGPMLDPETAEDLHQATAALRAPSAPSGR